MRIKLPLTVLIPVLFFGSISAQRSDSSHSNIYSPVEKSVNTGSKPAFSVGIFVLPAAMIGYGILAQNFGAAVDLNKSIQRIIWTDHPHARTRIDSYLQWTPAVAVYALNLAGLKGKNNFVDRSGIYAMALIIQSSTVYGIKKISHETRPNGEGRESFPSGHTSNAFAGAEFLRREYKDISPWYAVGGYVAAAATGYLRMYNNKHWFGDIVAGAGIGILSTDVAYALYPFVRRLVSSKLHSAVILPTWQNGSFGLSYSRVF